MPPGSQFQTGLLGDIGRNTECGIIDEELMVWSRQGSVNVGIAVKQCSGAECSAVSGDALIIPRFSQVPFFSFR
jgi:hypothetical protein